MPEDLYNDLGEGQESTTPAPPMEGATEGGETALIPKSLLAGKEFKPGEEVVLKIVHIFDDEVEVQYAPEKPDSEEEEYGSEEEGTPMEEAEGELESMATESEEY